MSKLERIETRSGRGIVVRGNDIDTDQIIPARYMTSIHFAGLEKYVFNDARFTREGTLRSYLDIKGRRRDAVMFSLLRGDL